MGDFITLRVSIPSNKSASTDIGWLSSVNPEADTEKGAIGPWPSIRSDKGNLLSSEDSLWAPEEFNSASEINKSALIRTGSLNPQGSRGTLHFVPSLGKSWIRQSPLYPSLNSAHIDQRSTKKGSWSNRMLKNKHYDFLPRTLISSELV